MPVACTFLKIIRLHTYRPGVSSQRVNKWVESTEWGSEYTLHGEQTCDDHVGYVT